MRKLLLILTVVCVAGQVLASNPTKEYVLSPAQAELQYDSLRITSKNSELAAWWLKGKDEKTVLIIAGGDAGNMSYTLPLATEFVKDLGWSVLLFDYRGFGASDTFAIDPDVLAYPELVDDVKASVAFVRKRAPKARIVLWGRSIGAVLSMSAVAEGAKVDHLVVESPYLPTQKKFAARLDSSRVASGSSRKVKIIPSNRLEPFKLARKIKTPTDFIMGENEKMILQEDLFKLSDLTPGMHSLFIAKGMSHLEFPSAMQNDFPAFLKETIDEKPPPQKPKAAKRKKAAR